MNFFFAISLLSPSSLIAFLIVFPIMICFLKKYFNGGVCRFQADLTSKIIIITGANKGIGKQTALEFAKMNATLIFGCRDPKRAENAKSEILQTCSTAKIDIIQLDLSDLSSVRNFTSSFKSKYNRLDILINNAGIISVKRKLTRDGLENIMATNYFGPFLLTNLLLDVLQKTEKSRIINMTSNAHFYSYLNVDDLNNEKKYDSTQVYGGSKLANIMFTKELAQRLEQTNVKTCCVHPGIVRTSLVTDGCEGDIFMKVFIPLFYPIIYLMTKNCIQGSQTTLHCSLIPFDKLENGKYYVDCKVATPNKLAQIKEMSKKLWEESERLVGLNR